MLNSRAASDYQARLNCSPSLNFADSPREINFVMSPKEFNFFKFAYSPTEFNLERLGFVDTLEKLHLSIEFVANPAPIS